MSSTPIHPDFRISFEEKQFTAQEFIARQNMASWMADVQEAVRFWLAQKDDLKVKTSGSTGSPKIISLSKIMLMASAEATISFFKLNHKSRVLLVLPAKFIGGKMVVFRAMMAGMNLTIVEPKTTLPPLDNSFDFVSLTPLQAAKSMGQLHRFKAILLGGGAVHAALEEKLKWIHPKVYHGYGMTETASHVALRALNGVQQSKVFEAVGRTTFQTDERSCLVIKAPHLFETELTTNDVVERIDKCHFSWLGRADNVLNSGGLKIHPEKLERILEPQIEVPFFVAGVADPDLGERVVLLIESAKELRINFAAMGKNERPKKVLFLPNFIYTDSQKINQKATLKSVQDIK